MSALYLSPGSRPVMTFTPWASSSAVTRPGSSGVMTGFTRLARGQPTKDALNPELGGPG